MSQNMGTIYYTVEARTAALLSAERDVSSSMSNMSSEMKKADRSASSLNSGLTRLAAAVSAVVAASALRDMAGMVQRYQEMSERVQMATRSTEEFDMVQKRLVQTANGTYRALEEAQELYITTADALRSMGYETSAAMDVQDSLSYSFVTNATTADRAQTAITAFSKSINTGKVAADQWETIMTAVPTVIDDIADASGKSAAEIRALGAAGKLTARDLSEGLRQSLDANAKAAGDMANTLVDAGVRTSNAITTVLVALEGQTGALDTLTNGIIMASDALLEFGGDAEGVADLLTGVQLAATSVAAVIAGRMLSALGAGSVALYQNTVAARAKATADLNAAKTAASLAAENLILAQSAARAATGLSTQAAAAKTLATAQAQATTATAALSAAQKTMAGTASLAGRAVGGLRAAMMLLGGPAGVALLAAGAIYTFYQRAKEAKQPTIDLTTEVKNLTAAQRELARLEASTQISNLTQSLRDQREQLAATRDQFDRYTDAFKAKNKDALSETLLRQQVALEKTESDIDSYQKRLMELSATPVPELTSSDSVNGGLPEITETSDAQKALASMREQIELAQLAGVARARLSAIQKLGAKATEGEREEAEKLATQLYEIEKAQTAAEDATKRATQSSEDAKKHAQENTDVLLGLKEQLHQVSLSAEELAMRQAELSLNEYATPDQIAEVQRLAQELYAARTAADELAKRKSAFGSDTGAAIKGSSSPLSGGAFDDQYARYEAEGQAEQKRYQEQMARLQEAKELELEVIGGYYALEQEMAQEHADRLAQIEQAKTQVLLSSAEQGFGAMADIMKTAHGEQSAAYKAMFVVSKAFSTANAALALGTALSEAWKLPWPANLAAAGVAAGSMATIAANISSVSMGSGRQYGGPASPGSMYRINENGAPEVFNAANGQQFMLPNTRGEVVSNKNASTPANAIAARPVNVTQNISVQGRPDRHTANQLARSAAREQQKAKARFG